MIRTVLQIDGMSCGMCESHVNDTIRQTCAVRKVTSSHRTGEAVILSDDPVPEEALRRALGGIGYTLLGVSSRTVADKPRFSLFHRG